MVTVSGLYKVPSYSATGLEFIECIVLPHEADFGFYYAYIPDTYMLYAKFHVTSTMSEQIELVHEITKYTHPEYFI